MEIMHLFGDQINQSGHEYDYDMQGIRMLLQNLYIILTNIT